MHTATWLSLHAELEKIAEEKKEPSIGKGALKGGLVGAGVGGAAGGAIGAHAGSKIRHVNIPNSVEKLLLNPKERKAMTVAGGLLGAGSGAVKGLQYGLLAGGTIAAGRKLLFKTKKKEASHGAELAGLGILAAPSIQHLRGKEMSEKSKSRAEVAGLGVLAAPSAMAVGKKALGKGKALLRAKRVAGLASKIAAISPSAMMNMHRLADAAKAARPVAKPAAQAATKLRSSVSNMGRATALAGHTATGGHAWNPAAAAKRAISL